MTGAPTIPKSKRSLVGLDDLIAESVAKEGTYHEMFRIDQDGGGQTKKPEESDSSSNDTNPNLPPRSSEEGDETMRLQIKLPRDLFLASKIAALHMNLTPSKFVALALREYLNLPAKT